jgi:hypothetical protein
MCITGKTTGEEKLFTNVERRDSAVPVRAAVNKPPTPDGSREAALKEQRVRKLEQELRRANDTIKKKNGEIRDLQDRGQQQRDSLSDAHNRTTAAVQGAAREASDKDVLISDLRMQLQREMSGRERGAATADARRQSELDAADVAAKQLLAQLDQAAETALRMKKENDARLAETNAAADADRKKAIAAAAKLSLLEKQLSDLRNDTSKADTSRRLSESSAAITNSAALAEALSKQRQSEATLQDWQGRINKCNEYIVRICQPKFTVVKDDSLAPMGQGDSEGFVLVPLQLLLEGYGLLPNNTKKDIAEVYEGSKKKPLDGVR